MIVTRENRPPIPVELRTDPLATVAHPAALRARSDFSTSSKTLRPGIRIPSVSQGHLDQAAFVLDGGNLK